MTAGIEGGARERAQDHQDRFVAALAELGDSEHPARAALAALRRGLGRQPGEIVEMCRYVDPWLPPDARWTRQTGYYLVAALFGWHPRHRPGKNLGGSLRELAQAQRTVGIEPTGVERRLVAVLNADADDLPAHLRHMLGLLRSHEIPVDYGQLLRDILRWDYPERRAQRDWARAYWSAPPAAQADQMARADAPAATSDEAEQPVIPV